MFPLVSPARGLKKKHLTLSRRRRSPAELWKTRGGEGWEEVIISGSLPAVLEVSGRAEGVSLRLSDRKSSMEGLSRGRLSCCSPTSWRTETVG